MKKGFTLVEMMLVVVIIAVLLLIVVPSVKLIKSNINKRQYESKIESIEKAAKLYASDNPDIFNSSNVVKVYVAELLTFGYLNSETDDTNSSCDSEDERKGGEYTPNGCIINPTNDASMNSNYVIITKEAMGYNAEFNDPTNPTDPSDPTIDSDSKDLIDVICEYFENGNLIGQAYYGSNEEKKYICKCNDDRTKLIAYDGDNEIGQVNACIVSGSTKYNFLKHDKVMYRVVGLYDLNSYYDESGDLVSDTDLGISAKLITNDVVDIPE